VVALINKLTASSGIEKELAAALSPHYVRLKPGLDELGVAEVDDLALLTDEETGRLAERLKPVEGRKFKAAMKARAMRARALGAMRARAFEAVQGSPDVASSAAPVVVAGATPVASAPPFAVTAEHA